jgi:hypothetical protein
VSPRRRYSPAPAASRASAQLVKYSILTILPSRKVVTWWYSVAAEAGQRFLTYSYMGI